MGISARKGNSGFLGVDARRFITSSAGLISLRKFRIERLDGKLPPSYPSSVIFEDNFSTGDFKAEWSRVDESTNERWMVGQNTLGTSNSSPARPIPSGSSYAAYVTDSFSSDKDNRYANSQQCYIYFDFEVPNGTATLGFDWMCKGENRTSDSPGIRWDYGYLMLTNTSFTPQTGQSNGYGKSGSSGGNYYVRISGSKVLPTSELNQGKFCAGSSTYPGRGGYTAADNDFIQERITLGPTDGPTTPSGQSTLWVPGEQRRLIFAWKSDSSVNPAPSWTIANVKLESD